MEKDMHCPFCDVVNTVDVYADGYDEYSRAWWICPVCEEENEMSAFELID